MKCPKCGFEIGENDTICRGCGDSVFNLKQILKASNSLEGVNNNVIQQKEISISDNTVNNQYQPVRMPNEANNNLENNKHIDNTKESINSDVPEVSGKYLRAYIGPNYESLVIPRSFSFCSLFLGVWYWAYRRDLPLAIVVNIIIQIIGFVFGDLISIVLFIIFNIYFSSVYKTIYVENAKRQVNEIVNNHKGNEEELLKELSSKGNPSWLNILILLIVSFIVGKII